MITRAGPAGIEYRWAEICLVRPSCATSPSGIGKSRRPNTILRFFYEATMVAPKTPTHVVAPAKHHGPSDRTHTLLEYDDSYI
jgi:hypothetical protein